MNNKIEFKKEKLKEISHKVVLLAKSKNKIKPISNAFTDVPTKDEDHKGNVNYFDKKE